MCLHKILTLFFYRGLCPITVVFFHHPFLNLSLISRFTIYRGFPAVRSNRLSAANKSLFHFLFNTCNGYAVGWGDNGGRSPLCEKCTDLDFPLFEKEIEMDLGGMVECSDQVHSKERTNK